MIHFAQQFTTAPWWGVPVLAGTFGVVGAVLGFLLSYINDRRKMRREDERRWHDDVRASCARFLAAANDHRVEESDREGDPGPGYSPSLVAAFTELQLIGPEPVVDAAERVIDAMITYILAVRQGELEPEAFKDLMDSYLDLVNAVRNYLGIDPLTQMRGTDTSLS